ncbi:dihydrolipoyl dehydrogenase [Parvibaculum sp.]|jgi:dihydrolipoamide dehydrogenase|uniref:dihydrolipoyl dehydrogenase n=1 Tax=Parvibaculum sp. TaxID=2024848 RepID=UPI000C46780E|nr:dihydrolipoyl dehydrogenase [Parvibaculum sp.]MAM93436.1 dihydrolipoyl dehydrogenase [Parvibaculum sp.]|tara:strand:- start:5026 stop:6423 length:1398 start_codon:yes stop_codon:yes gene_type:complete
MADKYDLVVIGSGPGGYVAAIRASQLGLKTAIVERDALGGICLNWGCIPTKALLRSAEVYETLHRLDEFGLKAEKIGYDAEAVVTRSRNVAGQLSNGVKFLMKKNKIDVIEGSGKLAGDGKVAVEAKDGKTSEITTKNIILATGARARVIEGLEPDGEIIWTYRQAMVPKSIPKSLIVVGSGAIGIEFASFYRAFGAEVTVVEVQDRILPVEDEEISKEAAKAFKKRGIRLLTGAKIGKTEKTGKGATMRVSVGGKDETLEAEKIISAVGIVGNVENIGLEKAGVKVEKTHVVVNEWMETGVKGIYAIGDLAGPPWLAHKASHEGILAAERIAGEKNIHPINTRLIPGCTYSTPQIASVGLTEAKAKEAGYEVKVGRFPFRANGKAIALGETEGFVKTVFDAKTGELLGAHMIGAEVTELIQGYGVAMTLETTEAELMQAVFPHPTLSEMMGEAVLDAYGRVLHT